MRIYIEYEDPEDLEGTPLEKIFSDGQRQIMLKVKYQLLYCLRSVEDELNACDGIIVIKDGGKFDFKDIPSSLFDKIEGLLYEGQQLGYFE